jgi:peptidyl-prolyl cis-trans isomerase D
MLEGLRNFSKSWFMRAILLALAATFVLFFGTDFGGGGHSGGGRSGGAALEIGDTTFTVHQIGREFNQQVQEASQRHGQVIDARTAVQIGILDQTIANIVTRTLFDQAAQDLGIGASIDAASSAIRGLPQFQDPGGRFSRAQFERFLTHSGQDEGAFVNDVRLDLLRNQYIGTIQNAANAPEAMTDTLFARRGERRIAEIVTVPLDASAGEQTPDEAALLSFFDANRQRFRTPEFRVATVAVMTPAILTERIVIPLEELEEEYRARMDEFVVPETRTVSQANFLDRDDAILALALVEGGKTFAEAAQEVSGLPPVELGAIARADVPLPELVDAAFTTAPGTLSAPVESALGWHIVSVTASAPGRTRPFNEVREALRDELAAEEARDGISDVLNDVDDGLAGGASLDEVARENGLRVERIDGIAASGLREDGVENDPEIVTGDVVARIFESNETGVAEIVENRGGSFAVVRLDEIRAPRIPALDEVREQAIAAWRGERARELADEKAQQIADRVRSGASLEALATEFGARFERTEAFDRTGDGATLALPLIAPLFEASEGDVVEQGIATGAAVARLAEIRPADPSDPARDNLAAVLAGQIANDLVVQLSVALQNSYTVEVDREALEATFAPQ